MELSTLIWIAVGLTLFLWLMKTAYKAGYKEGNRVGEEQMKAMVPYILVMEQVVEDNKVSPEVRKFMEECIAKGPPVNTSTD